MNEEIKEGETTVAPQPWSVVFTWKDTSAKITIKNGEDLVKIAEMLSGILTLNEIDNDLEITSP